MKLEVGKLYSCKEFFLILYPDPDIAVAAERFLSPEAASDASDVAYWSNRLGKNVSYTEKNIPLLVLNNKKEYVEVLAGDKKGWIIFKDWLKIKEIV